MAATGVRPIESLRPQLHALEGKDYAAYQSVRGSYAYNRFQLHIDQIPKDPYAPPDKPAPGLRVFPDTVCRDVTVHSPAWVTARPGRQHLLTFLLHGYKLLLTEGVGADSMVRRSIV